MSAVAHHISLCSIEHLFKVKSQIKYRLARFFIRRHLFSQDYANLASYCLTLTTTVFMKLDDFLLLRDIQSLY